MDFKNFITESPKIIKQYYLMVKNLFIGDSLLGVH